MTDTEKEQIALACLAAAFADGRLGDDERERVRHLVDELGGLRGSDLFRQVLDRQVDPEQLAASIRTTEGRRTAYEMALIVCEADGPPNAAEEAYLERLRAALGLSEAAAKGLRIEAEHYAAPGLPPTAPAGNGNGDLDRRILQTAILAGAAELLPQTAASLVVLPLQLKLVHDIGRRHGATGTQDQIRELITTFGVGATSQVVESMARRIFGGVARQVGGGGVLGGLFGGVAGTATGALVSFTTTWALGHAALVYYAQGRTLSRADLRALFQRLQDEAKTLYPRVEAEIRTQAAGLDAEGLLAKLRGAAA